MRAEKARAGRTPSFTAPRQASAARRTLFATLVAGLAVTSCTDVRRPASPSLVVLGSAAAGGFDRRAEPLADVDVTLSSGGATATARSSQRGDWRVELPVTPASPAVLTAWAPGAAPRARALLAGERTELQLSFALEPLAPMDCVDTGCTTGSASVRWNDAPSGASASVAWLAPLDAPALPSADALLTAVAAELDGGALAGRLWVRVPRAAWYDVVDARPGTGAIEVPVATFGPTDRAWRHAGTGVLRTEAGSLITEEQVPLIRAGQFAAGVVADVAPVARGVVGVFGAPAQLGCLEGVVTFDGAAVPGVTLVPARGRPVASDRTGAVCLEVPLGNEAATARAHYAGLVFSTVTLPAPVSPGTCGSGCQTFGRTNVGGDAVAPITPCRVEVLVVDDAERPLPGAVVIGADDGLTQASFTTLCGRMGTRCTLTGATDANGAVSLVLPVQTAVTLSVRAMVASGSREGRRVLPGCPRERVTLRAAEGHDALPLTLSVSGQQVSWTPPVPAHRIQVNRDGVVAWALRSFAGVTPPLTVGVTPTGADVEVPGVGALRAGDIVLVSVDSTRPSGITVRGAAAAQVE